MKEKEKAAPSCQGEGQARNSKCNILFSGYKPRASVVESKAVHSLNKHATKSGGDIISYKECKRVFSWLYHINTDEVFLFLRELEERGLLVQVPGHGVRILKNQEGRN